MDNFLQILFFLFIIFSFIAPLFKKKPDEGNKKKPRPQSQDYRDKPEPAANKNGGEDFDIMQEIQGMFDLPERPAAKPEPVEIKKTEFPVEQEESPYETKEWREALKTEHTENMEWHRKTTAADFEKEKAKIEEESKRFQKLLDEAKKPASVRLQRIRKSLSNPETFKEYYIISEILGKPRAYKRQVR